MATFAMLREPEDGECMVECIYNRELEAEVPADMRFFVLSEEVHNKFGIDYDNGEMLIYSPEFMKDLSCAWVAQTIDFDFEEAA